MSCAHKCQELLGNHDSPNEQNTAPENNLVSWTVKQTLSKAQNDVIGIKSKTNQKEESISLKIKLTDKPLENTIEGEENLQKYWNKMKGADIWIFREQEGER